jgi:hypothetical protein
LTPDLSDNQVGGHISTYTKNKTQFQSAKGEVLAQSAELEIERPKPHDFRNGSLNGKFVAIQNTVTSVTTTPTSHGAPRSFDARRGPVAGLF